MSNLIIKLSFSLIFYSISVCCDAYEKTYGKICRLNKGAEFSGRYKVHLAKSYCVDNECVAAEYSATSSGANPKKIRFMSPAKMRVGEEYFIFFSKMKYSSFMLPGSRDKSFRAPKGVEYFVGEDAVFVVEYPGVYYRDVPVMCFGGGEGCEVMLDLPAGMENKIEFARVIVPGFEGIKDKCNESGNVDRR